MGGQFWGNGKNSKIGKFLPMIDTTPSTSFLPSRSYPFHVICNSVIDNKKRQVGSNAMNDMDMVTDEDRPATQAKQCFTHIQSRKLLGGVLSCELCPSMDLIVFGMSSSASHHNLFRTVSWQKVATIHTQDEEQAAPSQTDIISTAQKQGQENRACCWSPNGRWIAVAADQQLSLYAVEPLANPPGGASFGSTTVPTEAQHTWTTSHPILAVSWVHVGRPHPSAWKLTEDEFEDGISWRYQSQFMDQARHFLPPSAYHLNPEVDGMESPQLHEQMTATALPECKTPLSVLCVSTSQTLGMYLYGLYPLLALPRPQASSSTSPPQVVASTDLTYFVVYSEPRLSLYHLPFMKRDRFLLQCVASLQSSITSHLSALKRSIVDVRNSWKSSLKPLDTKLQPLETLLAKYGVSDQPLGATMKEYILIGHTCGSSSTANAMDQFFTSVQMNDQLLQRMERSLYSSLANVESQARKGLQSPTQAMCYQIQEVAGLVQTNIGDDATISSNLKRLVDSSHHLWLSVEGLLFQIVRCRFRVRDLCVWLRSTGSQIKARGTAANSVQRENAKKRRADRSVLERLLEVFQSTAPRRSSGKPAATKSIGLTEELLSMMVSDMLSDVRSNTATASQNPRPNSPSSVTGFNHGIQTVPFATNETDKAAQILFQNPLSHIPQSIVPNDLILPQCDSTSPTLVAIHTRVGRDRVTNNYFTDSGQIDDDDDDYSDGEDNDESRELTFFSPRIAKHLHSGLPQKYQLDCRQWSVVAQANGKTVQLFCLPLDWKAPTDESDYDDYEFLDSDDGKTKDLSFYLTTRLDLPPSSTIKDVGFYSNDGKSSLSSGNDCGTGKEGTQKLGLLLEQDSQSEMWLIAYDSVLWQVVEFHSMLINSSQIQDDCTRSVLAIPDVGDDELEELEDDTGIILASTRIIPGRQCQPTIDEQTGASSQQRLLLCGSRGVGAVAWMNDDGVTTLDLLDLEEDEEDEDGEEENDDGEE